MSKQVPNAPNYTQVPNCILDLMGEYSDAELRVVLCVCRNTLGWHKDRVTLSMTTLAMLTGMTDTGCGNAVKTLLGEGVLERLKDGKTFAYSLAVVEPSPNAVGTCLRDNSQARWDLPPNAVGTPTKKERKENNTAEDFGKFWAAYPRKVGKPAAVKAFAKAITKATLEKLLEALAKHRQSQQWLKDDGQYIPHPATWLNQERWEDDIEVNRSEKPAVTTDPAVLAIGFLRFTRDKPPDRAQFDSDGQHQTYLTAWRKHFGVSV